MSLVESLRNALGSRRCVVTADVLPASNQGFRTMHVHIQPPRDGSGFTDEEATVMTDAAPKLAEHLADSAELLGLTQDGALYVFFVPDETTRPEAVVIAAAQWFDGAMKAIGSSLEVVDGPAMYVRRWERVDA